METWMKILNNTRSQNVQLFYDHDLFLGNSNGNCPGLVSGFCIRKLIAVQCNVHV